MTKHAIWIACSGGQMGVGMKKGKRRHIFVLRLVLGLWAAAVGGILPAGRGICHVLAKEDVIILRVCNWEEYIDLGDWDEEELIELDNGAAILGTDALYREFEDWFYQTYGKRVQVEYSCFGTNEDL